MREGANERTNEGTTEQRKKKKEKLMKKQRKERTGQDRKGMDNDNVIVKRLK